MPMYHIRCKTCGREDTMWRKIADRNNLPSCCGQEVQRIIVAPAIQPDIPPYESPVHPGRWIKSRADRRDDLARSGCIEWEPGIKEHVKKRREELVEKDYQTLETRIDETTAALEACGRI